VYPIPKSAGSKNASGSSSVYKTVTSYIHELEVAACGKFDQPQLLALVGNPHLGTYLVHQATKLQLEVVDIASNLGQERNLTS